MPTIDLSTPPPPPVGRLEGLPRRASLTLPELRLAARLAGGAPLPFDVRDVPSAPPIESRLGASPATSEDQAYLAALDALHDPETSLTRRGLLSDGVLDEQLAGAVGLLATPQVALDLDVAVGTGQARSWQRQSGEAVATLSTSDGLVFELAWFPTAHWAGELARIAVLPDDLTVRDSSVPADLTLPYELLDAAAEAVRGSRHDLLPVLVSQHAGALGAGAAALPAGEVPAILTALCVEAQGRLRALVADVSGPTTTMAGVVSWTLLADGWHSLRPRREPDGVVVEIASVQPDQLAAELAPVLAEATGTPATTDTTDLPTEATA